MKPLYLTDKPNERSQQLMEQYPEYFKSQGPLVFMTDKKEDAVNPESLTDYIATLSEEEKNVTERYSKIHVSSYF